MSSFANDLTARLLESANYQTISRRVDAIAIGLLIALLVQYELVRAFRGTRGSPRLRPLLVGIATLFPAFVLIVVVRSADLR